MTGNHESATEVTAHTTPDKAETFRLGETLEPVGEEVTAITIANNGKNFIVTFRYNNLVWRTAHNGPFSTLRWVPETSST